MIRGDARTEKTELENGLAEAARASHKAAGAGNKRLAEQTRKILAKHYASKYRVR